MPQREHLHHVTRTDLDVSNDSVHRYFIDNQRTVGHRSLIFGLRELDATESSIYCLNTSTTIDPPRSDQPFSFTSNYQLRSFASGCYFLDANNQWRSDGLVVSVSLSSTIHDSLFSSASKVGPMTHHHQTQCSSTHMKTLSGGFLVLPTPINWNYVFANAGFVRNKTIYMTLICALIAYILLVIYGLYKDNQDAEKVGRELP